MTPSRVRARRGEGDRLRDEILEAVEALLVETNDEGAVSIRAIADKVGVTAPSIYRHFADKEALLEAVCAPVFLELRDRVVEAVDGITCPIDAVAAAARCYVELGLERPEHYRIVYMRQHAPRERPVRRDEFLHADEQPDLSGAAIAGSHAFGGLLALVENMLAAMPDAEPPDPFATAAALWTAMHGVVALRITKQDFPWPSVDEQIDALLWPWRQAIS